MKKIIVIASITVLAVGGIGYYFWHTKQTPAPAQISQADIEGGLKEMGERAYKKRYYLTLAAVYEKMLVKMPESRDLKKKLADAYTAAGEEERAGPLFDELNKK